MAVPTWSLTCTRNERIAKNVHAIRFGKPPGFLFKPGQFVLFDVPLIENPGDVQTRALSIASTPAEENLFLIAKLKPGGRVSRYITEILRPGGTMTIKGPFGFFLLDTTTVKNPLFIATGAGLAPFRSQIMHALESGDRRRMDLIFGVRSEEDLFWTEDLTKLTQRYENFFLHCALSSPSPAWSGHRGRVQTLVPLIAPDVAERSVFVCGNPDMTTELKKLCLEEWHVPKEDLHVEGYI